jgi:hypothetical protein
MKKLLARLFLVAQLIILLFFNIAVFADPPGPPPPPNPVNGNPVVGQGAPIDDGVVILLFLGIAFGCFKLYEIRKKKITPKEEIPV